MKTEKIKARAIECGFRLVRVSRGDGANYSPMFIFLKSLNMSYPGSCNCFTKLMLRSGKWKLLEFVTESVTETHQGCPMWHFIPVNDDRVAIVKIKCR